jgi:hypothetical protein
MTGSPPVPLRVAMAFAAEAERRGISYAIGGALALGVWVAFRDEQLRRFRGPAA